MKMRIAEFTVDVPLAAIDDDSEYNSQSDLRAVIGLIENIDAINNNNDILQACDVSQHLRNDNWSKERLLAEQEYQISSSPDTETFSETFGGSLEDLVSHFDEKISHCFKNMTEETENIAPVQMRTEDEIMSESQIWWTLTGNFGNILPIDWSKSYARKLQLPALHLQPKNDNEETTKNELDVSDDEELAQAFDLHSLISSEVTPQGPPPQTADEVIEEIDEIMQQSYTSEWTACSDLTMTTSSSESFSYSPRKSPMVVSSLSYTPSLEDRVKEVTSLAGNEKGLWSLSYKDLVALHSELDALIQVYNEALVQELALREEMEYEKELKNYFISLLLEIQSKRRQWNADKKGKSSSGKFIPAMFMSEEKLPQYLTAMIPYDDEMGPVDSATLQRLIKILQAVNEDNSNVPNMLTDYILNVICPQTRTAFLPAW